jgi:hypothetical protein
MAEIVPVEATAIYEQRADLDGVEYSFTFRYAERLDTWFLDFRTAEGDAIFLGRACLLNSFLLRGSTHTGRPPGDLVFVPSTQGGEEASFDDFGGRVVLLYLTKEEAEAFYADR